MAYDLFGGHSWTLSKEQELMDPLVNRIDSRLENWKFSNLNMAGRVVLLKSKIDSLPSYWFNLFAMPSGVCQKN